MDKKHTMGFVWTPMLLENLPRLPLCHIMRFLPHSALLNLSLSSKKLQALVMREWEKNPNLWRHLSISPNLSLSGLISLRKALLNKGTLKLKHIKSIKITDSDEFLSNFMCKFVCSFHHVHSIEIQPNIRPAHIVKILNAFKNPVNCAKCKNLNGRGVQYLKLTKLNFEATRLNPPPFQNI